MLGNKRPVPSIGRLAIPQILLPLVATIALSMPPALGRAGERMKVQIPSTADGTDQPCYVILPDGCQPDGDPRPLVVSLHTFSGDGEQRQKEFEAEADKAGWIYLFPHFRGPNKTPEACGSLLAQQDILDAVDWAIATYPIDCRRVYLVGCSGGGHMAMLMAGRYPDRWTAVSAWVGISDLAAWHARHAEDNYGAMLRASCGGAPGDSVEVDEQYRIRSPLTWLHRTVGLPLDMAAGIHDGHTGSVPVRQTLDAFNAVARAGGYEAIGEDEIDRLSRPDGRLESPKTSDVEPDPPYGREIHLRRHAGPARVTIFEGGHEGLAGPAIAWLAQHVREG
ncbi:MAG: prolyl oligopeptidase family serine peptidase [Planctomycetaceae bacterium]|nr:prolyl oligopeptidase family serine peptidase [Planctomycetaceae bacterium]